MPKALKRRFRFMCTKFHTNPVLKHTKCHISTNLSNFLKLCLLSVYCQKLFALAPTNRRFAEKNWLRGNTGSNHQCGWPAWLNKFITCSFFLQRNWILKTKAVQNRIWFHRIWHSEMDIPNLTPTPNLTQNLTLAWTPMLILTQTLTIISKINKK